MTPIALRLRGSMLSERRYIQKYGIYAFCALLLAAIKPQFASCLDCNRNGIQDNIDISTKSSSDCNLNAIPDECEYRVESVRFSRWLERPLFGIANYFIARDIDANGAPDLVSTNYGITQPGNTISLRLNQGGGNFEPPEVVPVHSRPWFLSAGDFDGSGVDLAIVHEYANRVTLILNTKNRNFDIQEELQVEPGHHFVLAADLNSDSHDDLIIIFLDANRTLVFLYSSDGKFNPPSTYNIAGHTAVLDVDNDGDLDIVSSNVRSGKISLLLNTGDGRLERSDSIKGVTSSHVVASADLDADARVDLLLGSTFTSQPNLLLLFNTPDLTFGEPVRYGVGGFPAVGDLNRDSLPDIVVANSETTNMSVLMNDGARTFRPVETIYTGKDIAHISIADFDMDSHLDSASITRDGLLISTNDGKGSLEKSKVIATGYNIQAISSANLNPDDIDDLVLLDPEFTSVVMRRVGDRTVDLASYTHGGTDMVTIDINHDSMAEVIIASQNPSIRVLMNDGRGLLSSNVDSPMEGCITNLNAANLNGDGDSDLVGLEYCTSSAIALMVNSGDHTFLLEHEIPVRQNDISDVATSDFDGDGLSDIMATGMFSDSVEIYFSESSFQFPPAVYQVGRRPRVVVGGDINNDGLIDIIVGSEGVWNSGEDRYVDSSIGILLNSGKRQFDLKTHSTANPPFWLILGDVDADLDLDVISSSPYTNRSELHLNIGNGALLTSNNIQFGMQSLYDDNNDDLSDLAVFNPITGSLSLLTNVTLPPSSNDINNNGTLDECEIGGFKRGDAESDAVINLTDAIGIFRFLFQAASAPTCLEGADVDDNGKVNITDGIYLLLFLFGNGAAPLNPFLKCGFDSENSLGCISYAFCPE